MKILDFDLFSNEDSDYEIIWIHLTNPILIKISEEIPVRIPDEISGKIHEGIAERSSGAIPRLMARGNPGGIPKETRRKSIEEALKGNLWKNPGKSPEKFVNKLF